MKLKSICYAALSLLTVPTYADQIEISDLKYTGPFELVTPYMIDSLDISSKKWDAASLIDTPISLDTASKSTEFKGLPHSDSNALHLLNFDLDNSRYATASLKVEGLANYHVYIDGKKAESESLALTPGTRHIVIKYLTTPHDDTTPAHPDSIKITIDTSTPDAFTINPANGRRYTTRDIFTGRFLGGAEISPSGKYLYTRYRHVDSDGKVNTEYRLTETATGRILQTRTEPMQWMPCSEKLMYTRKRDNKTQLITLDPATGTETIIAYDLPEERFLMSPTEDFLIYTKQENGPKEQSENLYQILNPADRQPHWRDRSQVMGYNLATGISHQLTYGHRSVWPAGISDNGTKLLLQYSELTLQQRPSTVGSVYLLDLTTMQPQCLIDRKGFIASTSLSPDGRHVAITGSPEAFDGIGKNLQEGLVPSMYDYQLYILDVAKGNIMPVTRDFNPSIEDMQWSRADGMLYFTAADGDRVNWYRVNPTTGSIEDLNAPEENVMGFSLASGAKAAACYGEGADNSYRLYTLDTRKGKYTLRDDLHQQRANGIHLSPTHAWKFLSSRGDSISARFVLPPDFTADKKYPMIVYYYGGCSPTSRVFDSTYNPHLFAANGYVALVINPSGAAGFGQDFAARHVATAGEGVAQDIIDGVKAFTASHSYVDADKIGCCGASYGGFMTQYLQTVTDIFAAAISHAGISDHTSYWGEGYWGYSYSQVSMGANYPWSAPDLYVKQSPLYRADKINTPLLFLHGDADTNVPVGESIQMFTALKMLGKETALVAVKGENHHILDFKKREEWMATMFAWFAKYLQNDPSWWNAMYPEKHL